MSAKKSMKTSLLEIDLTFSNHYKSLLETQRKISSELKNYSFDLDKDEITQAVIERMRSFWYFNSNNCKDLNRQINSVASDFFTESCLFFLKLFFNQHGMEVFSEKNILKERGRKSIRPDLSIWKNNELIAVIELKVSDGWKGRNMQNHLEERKKVIQSIHPKVFFGAITFWNCFSDEDSLVYPDYFGLLKYDGKNKQHPKTGRTIEEMLKKIIGENLI